VQFEGNSVASDARLKTQIQSKPPLFWFIKGYVDRKKIDEDIERLTDYYRALGYFKATVGRDWEYDEDEDWMTLAFYINEGPRYTVRDISFMGNTIYDRNILTEGMKLKPGDFYDRAKMNADIGYIKDLYGSYGYVFADAQFDLQFDEQPGPVDILYRLTEGQQCVVGDINVHIAGDNPHTRLNTAINRLGLRPGDVIDIRKVRASERRLKSSNLFENDPTKGDVPRIVLSPPDPDDPSGNKSKRVAREPGDPNAVRGQSLDPPRRPQPTARAQSPDAYGGYGGTSVGQITPEPQAYSNQQPSRYTTQQPAGQQQPGTSAWQPQGTYTAQQPGGYSTQPPIVGAPPAGTIYPPNYAPGGQYAQGGYAAPNTLPPPGSYPPVVPGSAAPGLAPEVIAPPDDRPRIPLDIYLNEAQTGRFMFGAGVNSNAGLVGSIILDEQNFDWTRWPTSWEDIRSGRAFRGAGQKFRLEAEHGTEVSRYMFNFGDPYLFDTPVSLGLSGYYFQRFYRNWNEQRAGGRTSLGYLFTPDLSGSLSFRGEDILISNPSTNSVALLNEVLGHTQIYSFKGQVAWDTRDSTFLPTEGHYISLDVAYAVGTFQFPTYTVDFRKFFLLRERPDGSGRHVLSLYNQFGITGPDTPIYERFYAGGFSTLRGFQFRGASPQINTVEVGGDFQNLSSVEYMFPITADDMLRMVMFVDFGTVEQSVTINWDDFRVAPGFGFRISLPALGPAPIALDLAFPVAYADTDIKQIFSFFVGYSR
jgi:outer membrane protein insertion porin family